MTKHAAGGTLQSAKARAEIASERQINAPSRQDLAHSMFCWLR